MHFSCRSSWPTLHCGLLVLGLCGLASCPADAQIEVTSQSRSVTATNLITGAVLTESTFQGGDFTSTQNYETTVDETFNSAGATQTSNVSNDPALLSVSATGSSGLNSNVPLEGNTDLNVFFTLSQATPFGLFGSTTITGDSTISVSLQNLSTATTVFQAAPGTAFQTSGFLAAGTYYLSADSTTQGESIPTTRLSSFQFTFAAVDPSSAPVPEASTTVSFGLLLALGLGGMVTATRKRGRI